MAIGALGSPLGHHPESNLTTDLYSVSTPIAITDEFNRQISFNNLKKFTTLLSMVIGALGSPSGPHPKNDRATDLYSSSTPIAITNKSDRQISFKEIYDLALSGDRGIDSPLVPRLERDLATDQYSSFTPIAIEDKSDRQISFR
jgi:hypothetical protein